MSEYAYVGFDCSSKAIHCMVLDGSFNIVFQKKSCVNCEELSIGKQILFPTVADIGLKHEL